ncbi:MAG: hypothetical protein FK730_15235 [Asgard group archaeon]|nr:hypothetical protein [Asgard group archaeon]
MSELIPFYNSDLIDALYYFEYHGPLYKRIFWVERSKAVRNLFKIIRTIKFSRFRFFLPYARNIAAINQIDDPTKLAKFLRDNPPRGKFGEQWAYDYEKMRDILKEILKLYLNTITTKETREKLEKMRQAISEKYSSIIPKLKEESEKLPGIIWKRKTPKICLIYPLDGRLSHKLKLSDIAYIETSEQMLEDETLFLHEVVKLLNYTKPIGSWVRQDRRGIRAIAYEMFTELQTLKLINSLYDKKPNYRKTVQEKLHNIWIPQIRMDTTFDDEEFIRIMTDAYKMITKHEFDAQYQLGEIYTELNIILLT